MKRYIFFLLILGVLAGCSKPSGELRDIYPRLKAYNLLLISLDTLRADRLGLYGCDRPVSPFLDRLGGHAAVFADVLAQSPSTRTSHRAIFTSRYVFRQSADRPPAEITMAGILARAGWKTAAFTDGGLMHHRFGNDAGFRLYDDDGGGFRRIIEKSTRWIRQHGRERFFVFLHTYDIHYPYIHPEPYDALLIPPGEPDFDLDGRAGHDYYNTLTLTPPRRAFIDGRYAGGVRYCDALIMDLMSFLYDSGLHDKTVVVIVSDHGESLGEKNYVGHNLLYDVQLKVPMMIYIPGMDGFIQGGPVETVDLLPTLLHLLGVEPVPGFMGWDLASRMMLRKPVPSPRTRLSETAAHAVRREGDWKLIIRDTPERDELYRCDGDPEETHNLVSVSPEKAAHLIGVFKSFSGMDEAQMREKRNPSMIGIPLLGENDADGKLIEQMRKLGYVQ